MFRFGIKIVFLSFVFAVNALAEEIMFDEAFKQLKSSLELEIQTYKKDHPKWEEIPNNEYLKFYTEWKSKSTEEVIKLRENYCLKETKACQTDKEKEDLRSQTRVAIKVLEVKNNIAAEIPGKEEQQKAVAEVERAANVNLCKEHDKDCEKLPLKDQKLAIYLRGRDALLEGMEAEFSAQVPDWKERKGHEKVKDFLIRKQDKYLELTLKLSKDLCQEFPQDKEHCLSESDIESLTTDSKRENCLTERLYQLYSISKDELTEKEDILRAGHKAQWDSLKVKDCQILLRQDRMGENLIPPAPPAKVEVKEEVYGENADEKDRQNFDPETCKWVTDIPRKLIHIPGCGAKVACSGLVVCQQKKGGGKFIRTSTCSSNLCGASDKDAVACTKQPGFYSSKPKSETKEFVSEKLKRILSGVTKQ